MVYQLLLKAFGARNVGDQKAIMQQSRPMLKLKIKMKDCVFQNSWYSKKDWLCGSKMIESLFAGPACYSDQDHRNHGWKQVFQHERVSY